MKGLPAILLLLFVTAAPILPDGALHSAELVDYIVIYYPSISPNGDGVQDSSQVKIALLDQSDTLVLTLQDPSTMDVLDTLLFELTPPDSEYTTAWKGEDSLGLPLDEGAYTLHLFAASSETTEHYYSSVIVDITAPTVELDRIEPGIYTPGVPGSPDKVLIYYIISDSGDGDSLAAAITDPKGSTQEYSLEVNGDSTYCLEWSAENYAVNGIYTASFFMKDEAGNSSMDEGNFDVDTKGPSQAFINPVPARTKEVAPVLEGWCYDRNGLKDPELVWNGSERFPPDSIYWQADTLIWQFNIIDSVLVGGEYVDEIDTLEVIYSDAFGNERDTTMIFAIDFTPPPPPELNQPDSPIYEQKVVITGEVYLSDTDSITIYWSSEGDTTNKTIKVISSTFSSTLDLDGGTGMLSASSITPPIISYTIWAEALDLVGNKSGQSNTIIVSYDCSRGFHYPEVFRGPDVFTIAAGSQAQQVEIDIFTISGERVTALHKRGPALTFELEWNLLNDDGEEVRNGPYLVVITVLYNGSKKVDKNFIAVVR
ncbi:MAG: hypothetical protein KAX38_05015 [Candidatus Krumholzibacteria bacterium]|nr:hypothetical protein [Candidatus Krumholzibacteria bacterium]